MAKIYPVRPALQKTIVSLLAEGYYVKEIADIMCYQESSIETYILRMRREHGARNVVHLVHIWHINKLL